MLNYFNSPSSSSFLPEEGTMSAVQYCGVDSGHDMKPFTFSCVKNDTSSPTCGFFYKKRIYMSCATSCIYFK